MRALKMLFPSVTEKNQTEFRLLFQHIPTVESLHSQFELSTKSYSSAIVIISLTKQTYYELKKYLN